MNQIYFVRHGEGQDNVASKFSSTWMDHSLTERGQLQARQTGEFLADKQIDGIFCSPMKRAHETAQIISAHVNMKPVVLDEFRELNVGDLKVLQNHEDRRFVVVGHGGIFIATLKDLCPGLEMSWIQNAILYNCAITELEMEVVSGELNGRIVNWSDNSHLRGAALTTAPAIPPLSSIHEK